MQRGFAAPHRPTKTTSRHLERGLQFADQQRWEEAARALGQATRELPRHALAWLNLAQAQRKLGQLADAAESARRVLSMDAEPGPTQMARRLLASTLAGQGLAEQAADALQPLIDANVADPEVYLEAGDARVQARQFVVALQLFMRAAQLKPHAPEAHIGLGNCFERLGMPSSASECFRTASILDPRNTQVLGSAVHMAMHACRWTDLDADLVQLTARLKDGGALLPMPFSHLSFPGSTAAEHRQTAAHFWKTQTAGTQPLRQRSPQQRKPGRLRVGYLSNDFHEHATSRLIIEVLERHDRERVEVFLYSYGVDDGSDLRRRVIASSEHFIEMATMAPRAMAERIHADHIDILIDLKGYTQGCRSAVLGYRPAPIQVNWLGFPGTLASPLVDYIITDPVVTPLNMAADYDEKFAYLRHTYQPNDRQRPVGSVPTRAACGLPEDGVVFCCFNNTYKITPALFDRWCRLLTQVPGSVLWLLEANMEARDNLLREAQARGIDAARIVFAPKADIAAHLARLSLADLVLDTLPYNAHTTASDALWVGVPVITCPGDTFAARVAASLVTATGVTDTIASSLDEYEAIALRLAQDAAARRALRERLVAARLNCPLFDTTSFASNLEALYLRMLERRQTSLAPSHLATPPA